MRILDVPTLIYKTRNFLCQIRRLAITLHLSASLLPWQKNSQIQSNVTTMEKLVTSGLTVLRILLYSNLPILPNRKAIRLDSASMIVLSPYNFLSGSINGFKVSTIIRYTGCSCVIVSEEALPDVNISQCPVSSSPTIWEESITSLSYRVTFAALMMMVTSMLFNH